MTIDGIEITRFSEVTGQPIKNHLPLKLRDKVKTENQWLEEGYCLKSGATPYIMHPSVGAKRTFVYYLYTDVEQITSQNSPKCCMTCGYCSNRWCVVNEQHISPKGCCSEWAPGGEGLPSVERIGPKERKLFDCLTKDEQTAIRRQIGNYVSHDVVLKKDQTVATPEELNSLSRYDLARAWFNYELGRYSFMGQQKMYRMRYRYFDEEDFWGDIALYIDNRIPRAYLKHAVPGSTNGAPANADLKLDDAGNLPCGLVFHFAANKEELLPAYLSAATSKQLRYLSRLAVERDFYFYKDGLTKEAANQCITYLLDMKYEIEPPCFNKHFKKTI